MARIVQQGVITTSGTSFENEPIIKSDGVGDIMQWQPSDGGTDGVHIVENIAGDPLRLGVGVTSDRIAKGIHVDNGVYIKSRNTFQLTGSINPTASTGVTGVNTKFLSEVSIGDQIVVSGETRTVSLVISDTGLVVTSAFSDNDNDTAPDCIPAALMIRRSNDTALLDIRNDGSAILTGSLFAASGAVGDPSISFSGDTDTGIWRPGSNQMRFVTTGVDRLTIDGSGTVTIPSGTLTLGSLDIGHGAGTGGTADTESTAVGKNALDHSLNTSIRNTAIGAEALTALNHANGDYYTAVGAYAGSTITSGERNVAVGDAALGTDDGNYNVAIGHVALNANCENDNVAVGYNALNDFTGSNATAVGSGAADVAGAQLGITAVGKNALGAATSGNYNTAVGWSCLDGTIDGANNTAVGVGALSADCVNDNTAMGVDALTLFTGSNATAIGSGAADAATSATNLTAVGKGALSACTEGLGNTTFGAISLASVTTGDYNAVLGYAAANETSGSRNVMVGSEAGQYASSTNDCVAVGYHALYGAASFTEGGCSYNNDPTITHTADARIVAGLHVRCNGIPDSATIASITDSTHFELSTSTTGGNLTGQTLTFYTNVGDNNIAIGSYAAEDMTSGEDNVVIGKHSGRRLTTATSNVLIGRNAGTNLTVGINNIVIGGYALDAANTETDKNYNIAIGQAALGAATHTTEYNVAIGHNALALQTGDNAKNMAIGGLAGDAITTSTGNTLIGFSAGSALDTTANGTYNTVVGHEAMSRGKGSANVAIGYHTMNSASLEATAAGNVAIGNGAGNELTDGPGNVLIGRNAGSGLTASDYNIAIGHSALANTSTNSHDNIAIGMAALFTQQIEKSANVSSLAIGRNALYFQNHADANNLAIGHSAGNKVTTGSQNALIGYQAGSELVDDSSNTVVGYQALSTATAGSGNTVMGQGAMVAATTGDANSAIGQSAFAAATGAVANNTAIGANSLLGITHADTAGNVAIGRDAGRYYDASPTSTTDADGDGDMTKAINCVFIGHAAKGAHASNGDNEIVIGHNAVSNGTNTITLGNAAIASFHCDEALSGLSDGRTKKNVNTNTVGLDFLEKLTTVNYTKINPADWPFGLRPSQYTNRKHQQLVTPAVVAADAVYEDVVVVEAREAVEEVTETIEHPAVEAVYEDFVIPAVEEITEERVVQEACEEIKGERHKHDEEEVTEEVEKVEMVAGEGDNYIRKVTTETVTRVERTPLYVDHPVVNEDGTPCLNEDGSPVIHQCPVREEYVVQEAQEEVRETVVVREAEPERTERKLVSPEVPARTEVRVIRPAESAVEEVKERRLVTPAVEAKEAVYETVTVPADERPADDDKVRLGLIAQDVQTAMADAGVDFDLVDESPNGKLSLKYCNLVMPLIKAVQELSAEVKALKG